MEINLENYGRPVDTPTAAHLKEQLNRIFKSQLTVLNTATADPQSEQAMQLRSQGFDHEIIEKTMKTLLGYKALEKFPGA